MTARLLACLSLLVVLPAAAQTPAFPGAQGFGAYATGGRGGDVFTVTNLNSSGAGSLAEGIATAPSAGRTIVFAVSGYIHVPGSNLRIVKPNITIAGQTAPGDGIGLRNGTLRITGTNTVVRHLRIRHGKNGSGGDCLNVDSSAANSIVDHLSMQFSTDENISFFNSSLDNFTMQSSLSAWGLESHNAGGLWDLEDGTCHHSLWAHHHTRNPKARPYGILEWINNVTFDWGIGFIMGDSQTPAPWKANVRGSYFLSPPGNTDNIALEKALVDRNGKPNFSLYLDDCLHDADGDGLLNGTDKGYAIVGGAEFSPGDPPGANRYVRVTTPFPGATGNAAVTVHDPLTAYKIVVSDAGALRLDANFSGPLRDEVDTHLFDNVVTQKHSRITRESDLPVSNSGFGSLNSGTAPTDIDLDGMPDFWEHALGYNAAAPDHNTVIPNNTNTFLPAGTPAGFTRLEEYLHFLAIPHATVARSTPANPSSLTADLRKFTAGFSASPVFALTNVHGGTASLDGSLVTFDPTTDTSGSAGFNFTVTDADGSTWTRQFGILVTTSAIPRPLVWKGGNNANAWDTSTQNWQLPSGAATPFGDGDSALFDDRGSASPAVSVVGTRFPTAVTVTGTQDYTLAGGGALASPGPLTKAGGTTLTLGVDSTFAGGAFLNGGETVLTDGTTLGGGTIRFTGGSTLTSQHSSSSTMEIAPDIEVAAGAVGNLNLPQRVNVRGSLSGGGTFNIFSPSTLGTEGRAYFRGASAGCTGTINLLGGGGGRIAFYTNGGAFNGFGSARVHLSGISVYTRNNSSGNPYPLGSLSGDVSSVLVGAYLGGETTWEVGGLGLDSEFAGRIQNGSTAATNLVKSGGGTLALSGPNTYTGITRIDGGTLLVSGSLGNTVVAVSGGGVLAGSGAVGGALTIAQNATVSPGNAPGEAGTMVVAGGLELSAAMLRFDLSSNPATGNDRILNNGGTLVLRSPGGNLGAHFQFNLTDGTLGAGTYTLISGGTNTSAPGSPAFTHDLPLGTRQSFALQRSGGGSTDTFVRLAVTGTAANLTWTGSTSTWNIAGATPWTGGPAGDNRFFNLDNVTFTDAAATGTVNMAAALQPNIVTVENSATAYTFGGGGALAGNARLTKRGSGLLTVANTGTNTHSGGTALEAGILAVARSSSLGTGPVAIGGGGVLALPNTPTFLANDMVFEGSGAIASSYGGNSTVVDSVDGTFASDGPAAVGLGGVAGILSINGAMDGFSGTLDFGSGPGLLRLNANTSRAADRNRGSASTHFALGTASGALTNRNGDITIELGALSGGSSTALRGRQTGSGSTSTTYRIGALGLDTAFDGTVHHGGDLDGLHLVKTGDGTLALGGVSEFIGAVEIEAGTLLVSGSLTSSTTATVRGGATLDLAGGTFVADGLTVAGGAVLSGFGSVDAELVNDGTLIVSGGTLALTKDVVNNGILRVHAGASLDASTRFINNGVLDLLTAEGTLPSDLENNGIVITSDGLRITDASLAGEDVILTMETHPGHSYQLEWSQEMTPNSWQPVGTPVAGDGTERQFVHPEAAGTRSFYRISVSP